MTQNDKQWWQKFREVNKPYLENDEYRKICELHAEEFNHPLEYVCKCNPIKLQLWINELNEIFDQYGTKK
jgi:hypothetical protein